MEVRDVKTVSNKSFVGAEVLQQCFCRPTVFDVGYCKHQLRLEVVVNIALKNCGPCHIHNRPSGLLGYPILLLRVWCWEFECNALFFHPLIGLVAGQLGSVIWFNSLDGVTILGASPAQAVVCLQAFQPIAFLCSRIRLCHPGGIVCERKEVSFAREAYRIDWSDQICVYELVESFRSLLWVLAVGLHGLGSQTAITDVSTGVISVGNIEAI